MRYGLRTVVLLALILPLSLTACGKKPAPPPPAPVVDDGAAQKAAEERARLEAEAKARREAEARAAEEAAAKEAARKKATLEQMVFFDYDQSALRPDARTVLDAKIQILRADPKVTLRIGGHADERGSTEYNLALGIQRAQSIKDYLAGYGVDVGRLQTVSYGEERPMRDGHDEGSWSQNRRGDFTITGGLPGGR